MPVQRRCCGAPSCTPAGPVRPAFTAKYRYTRPKLHRRYHPSPRRRARRGRHPSTMQSPRSALQLMMLALLASASALPAGKAAGKGPGAPGATKNPAASAVSTRPIAPFADSCGPASQITPVLSAISARQAALGYDEVVLRGWAARRRSAVQGALPAPSPP